MATTLAFVAYCPRCAAPYEADLDPIVCSTCGDELEPCAHDAATGVDATPLDDPGKVWRCDGCGRHYHYDPHPTVAGVVVLVEHDR